MTIGIYILYFDELDKVYVGQSVDIQKRYRDHKSALQRNKHTNYKLQQAYNLYGLPFLTIIEECRINELDSLEKSWTKELNSISNGLNIVEAGKGTGQGPNNSFAKYNKLTILKIFRHSYLKEYSNLTVKEIAVKLNVKESTIKSLRYGNNHHWLQETYPTQYAWMKSVKRINHYSWNKA